MKILDIIAWVLLVVGGLNWGLALFDVNIVTWLFGATHWTKVVYGLVGLSALWAIFQSRRCCGSSCSK